MIIATNRQQRLRRQPHRIHHLRVQRAHNDRDLHLVVVVWAPESPLGTTRRPVDGHLPARPLSLFSALVRCAHGPLGPQGLTQSLARSRVLRPVRSASEHRAICVTLQSGHELHHGVLALHPGGYDQAPRRVLVVAAAQLCHLDDPEVGGRQRRRDERLDDEQMANRLRSTGVLRPSGRLEATSSSTTLRSVATRARCGWPASIPRHDPSPRGTHHLSATLGRGNRLDGPRLSFSIAASRFSRRHGPPVEGGRHRRISLCTDPYS